jgi:hypothetical protein
MFIEIKNAYLTYVGRFALVEQHSGTGSTLLLDRLLVLDLSSTTVEGCNKQTYTSISETESS